MRRLPFPVLFALIPLFVAACTPPQEPPEDGFVAGNCTITVASTSPSSPRLVLSFDSSDSGAQTTQVAIWGESGTFHVEGENGPLELGKRSPSARSSLSVLHDNNGEFTKLQIDGKTVQTTHPPTSARPDISHISACYQGLQVDGKHQFAVHLHLPDVALKFHVNADAKP